MSWTERERRKSREEYARFYKSSPHERNGAIPRADVDLIRDLSEIARATRRPGQTLQSRLNELRQDHEFVAPSVRGPTVGGAAIL